MQVLWIHNGNTGEWIRFREYFSDEARGIQFDLDDLSNRGQAGWYFTENHTRKSGAYGWYGPDEAGHPSVWRWTGDRWLQGVAIT